MNLRIAIWREPRRVIEWALRKKGLPEILVKAVMNLYVGQTPKLELDWACWKNFV